MVAQTYTRIAIWAHSECRSTAVLYKAVQELAAARGISTVFRLWGKIEMPPGRKIPLENALLVGDDLAKGRAALMACGGPDTIQVFCVYQNSATWRQLIVEAKQGGARTVIYAEAPCEVCLGIKALLKRLYYRWILPLRVKSAIKATDLFISQSGLGDIDRLIDLGWQRDRIVPFGYASPPIVTRQKRSNFSKSADNSLRILHLGCEAPYRGLKVLESAISKLDPLQYKLVKTGGKLAPEELVDRIRSADVVVGCGICEPWGMRINDVLLEGTPVIVSDGMGAKDICTWFGCGCVVRKNNVTDLRDALIHCHEDKKFLASLRLGASKAAKELLPENRAKPWLSAILGEIES